MHSFKRIGGAGMILFFSLSACEDGTELRYPSLGSGVSIIELIIRPEKFHGKFISVKGYLHLEFESTTLFLSEEDDVYANYANSIAVDFESLKEQQLDVINPHHEWVLIQGVFSAEDKGHMGGYVGTVGTIEHIEVLQKNWAEPQDNGK